VNKISAVVTAIGALFPFGVAGSADYPSADITNGLIRAKIYLPHAQKGFYRGTRFDWSGVICSLQAGGHNYYGPWFDDTDLSVHDFVYRDPHIVAGPCSAITGPVDEFGPVGYDEAKPGGTFIKIGIGALIKPNEQKYDNYHLYEIADGGKWTIGSDRAKVKFVQQLSDSVSGYAYVYEKDVRLTNGKTEMVLAHRLKNVGKRAIQTSVYNHNFLVLDRHAPGPGVVISVPFTIRTPHPVQNELAEIRGNQIVYLDTLKEHQVFATPLEGFGTGASDNMIRIENTAVGAGIRIQTDSPLLRESLWSIRTVVAMEPFIAITVEPGAEFTWTTVYDYYALPQTSQ